jgi:uncharacterized protein (TIGR02594 family)
MPEPLWMTEARKHIGLAEIPGPKHHPEITRWLKKLGGWWSDDETPWCGTFVAHCMQECGIPIPKFWMRAKAWAEWGARLAKPITGCVVVFERKGGGHVGFVVGRTQNNLLMVLGGNQGNRVSIAPFESTRVIGFYWPMAVPLPVDQNLPLMLAGGPVSMSEA